MADLAVGEAGIDGAEKVLHNGAEYSKDRHARVYKEMIAGNPYVNDRSTITVRDLTPVVGGVFVTPGAHMRGVGVAGGPFYFSSTAHMVGYPRVPRDPNLAEAIASAVPRSGP